MPNNRNKKNQPPTRQGKKRSPSSGDDNKRGKRPEAAQTERDYPEGDYGAIARDEGSDWGIVQRRINRTSQRLEDKSKGQKKGKDKEVTSQNPESGMKGRKHFF